MEPNQKETWTAVISAGSTRVPRVPVGVAPTGLKTNLLRENKNAAGRHVQHAGGVRSPELVVAEMVATLYDESLDAFAPHHWMQRLNIFRQDYSTARPMFQNMAENFNPYWTDWHSRSGFPSMTYRHFPYDLTQNIWGYQYFSRGGVASRMAGERMETFAANDSVSELKAPASVTAIAGKRELSKSLADKEQEPALGVLPEQSASSPNGPDLSKVTARKNLNETAFFFPQLTSDSNGVVRMTFTLPEALTQWKFMGFAHDKNVRSGFIDGKTVTSKDLMVQPNPPRFLREGDEVEFVVKISNQSDATQKGKVRLTFDIPGGTGVSPVRSNSNESGKKTHRQDARATTDSTDKLLGNGAPEQSFEIPAKESRSFSWKIKTPEGLSMLSYKAVAATDKISDGEEGIFPVLSRRILVTESMTLPIRGPAEKNFKFTKLLESADSDTLRHQNLAVQMVSNPSWYAVMALPYLMEFPYECSEQIFNRFYANSLARHIAKSDPKIHKFFEQWRGTTALDSPLEKNQGLKSVTLEESPWVRQAQNESQARRNVGILFEDNRLD
jgi:hypothetical protein